MRKVNYLIYPTLLLIVLVLLQVQFYLQANEDVLDSPIYSQQKHFYITRTPQMQSNFKLYYNLSMFIGPSHLNTTYQLIINHHSFWNYSIGFIFPDIIDGFPCSEAGGCNYFSIDLSSPHFMIPSQDPFFRAEFYINRSILADNLTTPEMFFQ